MLTRGANGQANLFQQATTLLFEQCPVAMVVYDRALRVTPTNEAMAHAHPLRWTRDPRR